MEHLSHLNPCVRFRVSIRRGNGLQRIMNELCVREARQSPSTTRWQLSCLLAMTRIACCNWHRTDVFQMLSLYPTTVGAQYWQLKTCRVLESYIPFIRIVKAPSSLFTSDSWPTKRSSLKLHAIRSIKNKHSSSNNVATTCGASCKRAPRTPRHVFQSTSHV